MTEPAAAEVASPLNGVKGWLLNVRTTLEVAAEVAGLVNKIGLALILVGIGLAVYFGFLESPLATKQSVLDHEERTQKRTEQYFKERAVIDGKFVTTLDNIQVEARKNGLAYRKRICDEIRDTARRFDCIRDGDAR